jgi:hypothetical protein
VKSGYIISKNRMLEIVKFENDEMSVFRSENQIYVAIRPICEALGLDADWQIDNLRNHEVLAEEKKVFNKFVCLPIHVLNGWLFGIQANKAKPEVREKLKAYQKRCYEVLYNHFFGKHKAIETIEAERFRLLQARRHYEGTISHAKQEIKKIDYMMDKLDINIFGQLALMEVKEKDLIDIEQLENYVVLEHELV